MAGLFAATVESIYREECRHYNWRGSQMLGEAVAELVVETSD